MPAGYTYVGQFVDHDLTFDRTDVALGEDVTPAELVQGRSPRLDLDSLYGVGPGNPGSAKFYEADGLHLKTGNTIKIGSDASKKGHDLPRVNGERTALIPDPRNDENLIVAQTHLAMIRFHNKVVDDLPASTPVGAAVPQGPQAGHAALPVDAAPRLPAADRRPRRRRRRLRTTAASSSSRTPSRPTYRRCRWSSRSRRSGSVTA